METHHGGEVPNFLEQEKQGQVDVENSSPVLAKANRSENNNSFGNKKNPYSRAVASFTTQTPRDGEGQLPTAARDNNEIQTSTSVTFDALRFLRMKQKQESPCS